MKDSNKGLGEIFDELNLRSVIKEYDQAIAHYDFVIGDISSEVYDPVLSANRGPALAFLTAMRDSWKKCRDEASKSLKTFQ